MPLKKPTPGRAFKQRRKAPGKRPPPVANPLNAYVAAHLEWLAMTGYRPDSVDRRGGALRRFAAWADSHGLTAPEDLTLPVLERYQRHLYYYRKRDGAPLTLGTQLGFLAPLKTFGKWLARERHLAYNPASELQLPRPPKALPRSILTAAEVDGLLATADITTVQGVRDRALLELLYATGLRRREMAGVRLYDLNAARGLLHVREGKGGRERLVPVGARALAWVDKYLIEARPQLQLTADEPALFLNDYGEALSAEMVARRVKLAMERAGIERDGATHLLRHACATHMLEGGADIRYIQAMLGHADIGTTEIYTHVSLDKLKAVHAATHPGARLERQVIGGQAQDAAQPAARALLEALAAADDDEEADWDGVAP